MAIRLDHKTDELTEVHEINVTPFIDVMLVLLIIFMVAAPLATVDVAVNLPSSTAQPLQRPKKPVYLTVKPNTSGVCATAGLPSLSLAVGDDPISLSSLGNALDGATGNDKDQKIFLRADRCVPYGDVVQLMNEVDRAGYKHFDLVLLEMR